MSQQWSKGWIVRAVGPNKEVEYYVSFTNDKNEAERKVKLWLKNNHGQDDWQTDEAKQPVAFP